jgi:mRNA degradation ribonuclease J1/J2
LLIIAVISAVCSGSLASATGQKMTPRSELPGSPAQTVTLSSGGEQKAEIPTARRVFVRSKSLLVRAAVVEDKLLKRPEFKQLGFAITREESDADLILELRHDLLTKYVFSVVDVNTRTVVASGKVSSLGGTVAGKVAKRFVKEMARTPVP